jgi:hypothetical protein
MTSSQSRRRAVYRLYGEDEFLGGAGAESFESAKAELVGRSDTEMLDDWTPEPGAAAQRLRRLAGTAMLLGAVGFGGGAILKSGSRPSRAAADRRSDMPVARAYALTATPRAAAGRPSAVASGTAARRGSSARARQVAPPARRLFAQTHPSDARRRPYGGRSGGTGQLAAVDQRSRVTADPAEVRPGVAGSTDTEPAAAETADGESSAAGTPTVGSPASGSPIVESRAAASPSVAHPVATGSPSSPRQMEFGFER